MNNKELLKAISTLLIAGQNNYHISIDDLNKAEKAMQTLTNILKHTKGQYNEYAN